MNGEPVDAIAYRALANRLRRAELRHAAERERLFRLLERDLDLPYLATCVLEGLIADGILPRMEDEEQGKSTDEWALAHAAAVAALQRGLAHLAQEQGERDRSRIRLRGFEG